MNKAKVFFLHIPKTAGTSVREYFEWSYPAREICAGFSELSISEALAREGPSRRFYSGHVSFDYLDYFFPEHAWLTFLRDPLARTVSQYSNWITESMHQDRWLEGEGSDALRAAVQEATTMPGIAEFVMADNPIIRGVSFNPLTRNLISGQFPTDRFEPDFYDEALVDEALRNLTQRFAFFGITERMADSLELLGREFAHLPRRIERKNTTERKDCTPEETAAVERMIRMDTELYRRACDVFAQRVESSAHWSSTSAALQALQGAFQRNGEIRADSPVVENGWGFLQEGQNGLRYRWTEGSSEAPARLLVPDAEDCQRVRLFTFGFVTQAYADSLVVTLGDTPLALEGLRTGNYGNILSWRIPPDAPEVQRSGSTWLSVLSPKSLAGAEGQQRNIGFALFKAEVI
ncbi:MAG: sulfotransferase family 2 domain-containing protein [Rhodoferax sp.]|nr:sulfotransferase family 2 domain-containing protein [Rhodoferax sp.]